MKVKKSQNHLYIIKLQVIPPVCVLSKMDETAWLWHARLGHLNFEAIRKMSKEGLAKGIPKVEHKSQVCEACLVGKQKQLPFPPQAKFRANQPLELIHADLCGPISPSTPAGNRYFLLLVDDFSTYMWIHMLKSKYQALDAFKIFKQAAELECGFKVKAIRTNRGGEFTSTKFKQVCSEDGIRRFLTAPYTPQQNGVVERRNQTILGTTRSILKAMKLPQWTWGEGARHAVYILNRTPTKAVEKGTPYEAYKSWKPNLEHLKVFGCLAHVKVPTVKLTKLEDKSEKMVNLGTEPISKAYRLYNPKTGKIHVSRDVRFEKHKPWNWEEEGKGKEDQGMTEFVVEDFQGTQNAQTPIISTSGINTKVPNSPPSSTRDSSDFRSIAEPDAENFHNNSPPSASSHEHTCPSSCYDDTPPQGFRSMSNVMTRTQVKIDMHWAIRSGTL
ncbi:hypothetical protein E3N88_03770 [Mikania micrantha]|uniref:Integrase catalytic domain-containing protein n=1 Tax=Mikania micrantha TaxID=192012 RepID=A0A5N6PT30_9ASTR|nr:hypothetical protein E3N88_03770 [Mikania micrantha]